MERLEYGQEDGPLRETVYMVAAGRDGDVGVRKTQVKLGIGICK